MTKGAPTIAATSTLAMVRTAEQRGLASDDLLRAAGIARATLEDPDARLTAPTVITLWNALRERAGDPLLQLSAPATLPFGAYRVIDYLVAASATVGDGVEQFARFFGLIAEALSLSIERRGGGYALELLMVSGAPVPPVYVDYVFAALVTRIRMRIRPELRVHLLELRQVASPAAERYRELFGAPVRFGTTADRLTFSDAEWRSPMATADAALARLLEEHARILASRAPRASTGIRADVERAITARPAASGSAAHVARMLNMSVRTLQRRLVDDGMTFRSLSDELRSQLACGHLADRRVSVAEVACLLGFSDQRSFNRAFQRWTGAPPGRWRQERGVRG